MKLRELLARRLRELMDARPDLDTQMKVAAKSKLGQSTIQRILSDQQAATVDVVEALAKAFGISPVELLIDDRKDAQLLLALGKLDAEEKLRVLSYIEVSSGVAMRHHAGAQLNIDSGRPVPPQLTAATQRASSRRPGFEEVKKQTHEKTSASHVKRGKS